MRRGKRIILIAWGIAIISSIIALVCSYTVKAKTYTDKELFERVVEAEAGNQDLKGKRLVAAVIYNRVASEEFPDTIREVLTEPKQFSTVSNGSINRVEISVETKQAIQLEENYRTDPEILYFNSGPVSGKYAYTYKGHKFGK